MKKVKNIGLITAAVAACLAGATTAVAFTAVEQPPEPLPTVPSAISESAASAQTPSALFSSDTATITAAAHLPEYMQKVTRPTQLQAGETNAQTLNGADITAVKVVASEVANANIKFNNIVDLSFFDVRTPIIEVLIAPEEGKSFISESVAVTQKDTNFGYLDVELTDVYDPTNVVTMTFQRRYDFFHMTSAQVSTGEQQAGGWVAPRGYMQKGFYGTPIGGSFAGSPSDENGLYRAMSFNMDYESSRVYASPDYYSGNDAGTIVRGLNERKYLLDGDELWNGFTTGEVYMNIRLRDIFKDRTATVYILSAAGIDTTGADIVDLDAPVLRDNTVDKSQRPRGEIGSAYPYFDVSAYDYVSGKLDAVPKAYYDYNGQKTLMPENAAGDAFVPDKPGLYTIEYTATDEKGLSAKLTIDVDVAVSLNPLSAALDADEFFAHDVPIGSSVKIPDISDVSVFGGSGCGYTVTRTVSKVGGGEIEIGADGRFTPAERGYYSVRFDVKDYLSHTYAIERLFKAEAGEYPLAEMPYLPEEVAKGKPVYFPKFDAVDYMSFGSAYTAETVYFVSEDDEQTVTKVVPGSKFTPKKDTRTLHVTARASNIVDGKYVQSDHTVKIVDTQSLSDFFRTDEGVTKTVTDKGEIKFTSDADAKIAFLQPLMSDVTFKFSVPKTQGNWQMKIDLQDGEKSSESVAVRLVSDGTAVGVYVGEVEMSAISGAFAGNTFTFSLLGTTLKINEVIRGDLKSVGFNGFSSPKVFFSFEMLDVVGTAGVTVSGINNQTYFGEFSSGSFDNTAPVIRTREEIDPVRRVGELITVPVADVFDVLDTEAMISVRVTDSANKIIFEDRTGTKPFVFRAEKPETYTIQYVCVDSSMNQARVTFTVRAISTVKPTVKLDGVLPTSVQTGSVVSVPNATATDAFGNELEVKTFVIRPDGTMIEPDGKFKADVAGGYTVRYYAVDGSFNAAIYNYSIRVGG